ncbi:fimbrial protein [Pseudomonas sp. P9_35]|uniref:fimbrial protein n=1 Tax=unclassified Pseudomonas TaxID=196821 RepID=UPI002A369481|nr:MULTISPECIES: fimbrial protein [unclassified Pseudomonas]WPN65640.1 fimbrial protein [Pseudomonas sp. P9_32]WPN71391.1 fimbrial protein [Pseudomonas sp. P9_35]
MKLNKLMMAVALTLGSVSFAHAADEVPPVKPPAGIVTADQGHGSVTFAGSIIDAPCSIAPESIDQVVELGQISNAVLADLDGKGASKPKFFSIKLEGCALTTAKTVKTTFTGAAGKDNRLGVTGGAKGASIVITDGSGQPIQLGQPTTPHALQNGDNELTFSAFMQGDGNADAIVPGEFKGVVDFSLAYQ